MKYFVALLWLLLFHEVFSQTHQINLPRVDQMPDEPAPYLLRDWKTVAIQYDVLIFDQALSGTYLPLLTLKPSGRNYPDIQPIQLDTYVGTSSETQAEAINIIPAIVGASLVGTDKSNQNGVNWVGKIRDFFNSANGQNVYLNGTNASSGNDWWYDVMPNVFFYQAYDLYPGSTDFDLQFRSVADRWLQAVYAMGGKATPWTIPSMNYRGWYLSTMTGNSTGVKEPEAAGSIAWLLYSAYSVTGERKYLDGARMCMDYLASLNTNPSYELQLPYGIQAAAKLNATLGSDYDLEKMMNWAFDRGPLRGWGTIVGNWDGNDISGLIGEANDAGNDYAFMMNGYQQAAALAPVAKYDKRYARVIAKWILNLANASRFFYPAYRPADRQDDFDWSDQYDPASVIGYEALKEDIDGKKLYGTGDAKRNGWAATNLALYGSSHVGYLAAIVDPTNVERILRIDLNKTDFFADNVFDCALFFNPSGTDQQVAMNEGSGPFDVYDAISESFIATNVSGDFSVEINSNEVVLLTFLPAGTQVSEKERKLYAGDHILDYHYGYDFTPVFRIKSLATDRMVYEFEEVVNVHATVENTSSVVSYRWFVNDILEEESTSGAFSWTAPGVEGESEIKVEATQGGMTRKDSLTVSVVEVIPSAPLLSEITSDKKFYVAGEIANIVAHVVDADQGDVVYEWIVPSGNFTQSEGQISWTTSTEGLHAIRCVVTNRFDLSAEKTIHVLVKSEPGSTTDPLAYYPLNNDALDYSGNEFHGTIDGTQRNDDPLGMNDFARRFSSSDDIIYVPNSSALNFRDAITLSFWISPAAAGHEAFILSHGSWEERWKVSITPEKKLRWTVKTDNGTVDLDSSEPLTTNAFIHVAVVFSGYSMELYINGVLDGFTGHAGLMMTTGKNVTFGQKDNADRQYFYNGVLDEVRIYDAVLQPDEISLLQTLWRDEVPTAVVPGRESVIQIYPNPASGAVIHIEHTGERLKDVGLFGLDGRSLPVEIVIGDDSSVVRTTQLRKGIHIVKLVAESRVFFVRVLLL